MLIISALVLLVQGVRILVQLHGHCGIIMRALFHLLGFDHLACYQNEILPEILILFEYIGLLDVLEAEEVLQE